MTPQCSASGSTEGLVPVSWKCLVNSCPLDYAVLWSPWSWLSQLAIWFQLVTIRLANFNLLVPHGCSSGRTADTRAHDSWSRSRRSSSSPIGVSGRSARSIRIRRLRQRWSSRMSEDDLVMCWQQQRGGRHDWRQACPFSVRTCLRRVVSLKKSPSEPLGVASNGTMHGFASRVHRLVRGWVWNRRGRNAPVFEGFEGRKRGENAGSGTVRILDSVTRLFSVI